jgi:hypothetical protein
MHTHPNGVHDFALMIAHGVTGTRVMAGGSEYLRWRKEIDNGKLTGPTLMIAGPILFGPSAGEGNRVIQTPTEAIAEIRRQKSEGYDFIKIHDSLTPEVYRSLVAEARRMGMPVIGHVPMTLGATSAIDAGQQCVEHLHGYCEDLVPSDAPVRPGTDYRSRAVAWRYVDSARLDALAVTTREAGMWNCPTLSIGVDLLDRSGVEAYLGHHGARLLPRDRVTALLDRSRRNWLADMSESDFQIAVEGLKKKYALVHALHRAGARLLAGSDMDPWGYSLHYELEQLAEAGLTTREALAAATINPAEYADSAGNQGQVRKGFSADLVILNANPLNNIRNTRQIHAVILKGRLFNRRDLDTLITTAIENLEAR